MKACEKLLKILNEKYPPIIEKPNQRPVASLSQSAPVDRGRFMMFLNTKVKPVDSELKRLIEPLTRLVEPEDGESSPNQKILAKKIENLLQTHPQIKRQAALYNALHKAVDELKSPSNGVAYPVDIPVSPSMHGVFEMGSAPVVSSFGAFSATTSSLDGQDNEDESDTEESARRPCYSAPLPLGDIDADESLLGTSPFHFQPRSQRNNRVSHGSSGAELMEAQFGKKPGMGGRQ